MAIGRPEDQQSPYGDKRASTPSLCLGADPRNPSGPAVIAPRQQAGHMTACDRLLECCKKRLRDGGRPHMSSWFSFERHRVRRSMDCFAALAMTGKVDRV